MFLPHLKYTAAAVTVISLLTSCAGGVIKNNTARVPTDSVAPWKARYVAMPLPLRCELWHQFTRRFPERNRLCGRRNRRCDADPGYQRLQHQTGASSRCRRRRQWQHLRRELYSNNSVTVYAASATGNVAPIQDIRGSMTGLFLPEGLALSPLNGDIYIASRPPRARGRRQAHNLPPRFDRQHRPDRNHRGQSHRVGLCQKRTHIEAQPAKSTF